MQTKRPKVVLDTQGGDRGPAEVIAGGLLALEEFPMDLVLAGDRALIEREIHPTLKERVRHPSKSKLRRLHPEVLHAPEVVTMEDAPAEAVRRKKESSLVRGIEAVRRGEADAFVSPANTGAVMAAALLRLGRIRGIDRPGIAAILPTVQGRNVLVIDVGANVDCSPENLKEFAIMGTVYAREILGVEEPRVGLLNIGSERRKGNELALKTFFVLEELPHFAGNVEAHQILQGEVDVVVCDGFVGNVLLKSYEGGASATVELLKKAIERDWLARLGAFILIPALKNFKRSLSAARYGGAPLLGVRGVVIIAHGNSDAEAIKNAVRVAVESVRHNLVEKIERGIARYLPAAPPKAKEVTA
jgi:glycerol-3-phosphate acyltransferase PlsX